MIREMTKERIMGVGQVAYPTKGSDGNITSQVYREELVIDRVHKTVKLNSTMPPAYGPDMLNELIGGEEYQKKSTH